MLTASRLEGVSARSFHGSGGGEHVLIIEPDPGLAFEDQLAVIERRYAVARRRLGLAPDSAVFRRLFVSDLQNQMAAIERCEQVRDPVEGPVALSIVEQAPLNGAKAMLLAYHIQVPEGLMKRRLSRRHVVVEKNGARHLWSTRLCVGDGAAELTAEEQTRLLFSHLTAALGSQSGRLADHCVRTWIYVKDVDIFYGGMGRGRSAAFAQAGLSETTHYIASTGIEGACAHACDLVAMDAYSAPDLAAGQLSYLSDPGRMCPTKDYGVTFERGARVAYADRSHLFISGTASIDAHGQVVHPGDVLAQLDRAVGNVQALLATAGAGLGDLTYLIVYLRDPADYPRTRAWLDARFGDLPMVVVRGAICRPAWLIEIEGVAVLANNDPALPRF